MKYQNMKSGWSEVLNDMAMQIFFSKNVVLQIFEVAIYTNSRQADRDRYLSTR
jgi:hypothetical protein